MSLCIYLSNHQVLHTATSLRVHTDRVPHIILYELKDFQSQRLQYALLSHFVLSVENAMRKRLQMIQTSIHILYDRLGIRDRMRYQWFQSKISTRSVARKTYMPYAIHLCAIISGDHFVFAFQQFNQYTQFENGGK